jgi:predicted nuclease of restriction endonuclease-like (RecB) superfamily
MIKKTKDSSNKDMAVVLVKEYTQTLAEIKKQIKEAQTKAILCANQELLKHYWSVGKTIVEKKETNGWGSNIIEKLADDLQSSFPGISGFSKRNVFRMQAFYLAYQKVPQLVAQIEESSIFNIPWGHNAILLEKLKDNEERLWYAQKAIEYGWSRSALETWIKSDLYK